MTENIFDRIDDGAKSFKDSLHRFIAEYFPYIMLIGILLFEVLARLFEVEIAAFFTPDFWSTLFINTMSSTLTFAGFVFYAERKKRETDAYRENLKAWSIASQRVRMGSFDDFIAYCKSEYEKECEERRRAIIANNTQISVKRWEEEYRGLSDSEIDALSRGGVLSRHEARMIKRANKHPRLKPINPLLILAGMKIGHINSAGRSNTSSIISVLTRPIPIVVMSVTFSLFAGRFLGASDSSVLFDMLYTAGMIVMSSMMGYMKGADNAEKKHGEIKVRIMFIERYEKHISANK